MCAITIGTEAQTYEILLGDYSAMDDQRYVSFGDGNVYLAVSDPMDQYDAASGTASATTRSQTWTG